ncbi:hypothetical protein FCOIX_867 [Fusarium coicis]|nr:hypothetical protein FCOIX_867 [Fusarium coicis]
MRVLSKILSEGVEQNVVVFTYILLWTLLDFLSFLLLLHGTRTQHYSSASITKSSHILDSLPLIIMHDWSGWSCTGTIFTAIGAIFTFLAFLLMASQAFFPQWFPLAPIPPTLPPSDDERRAAQTLQSHRDEDTRHLRTISDKVSLLMMALSLTGGGEPEVLWVRLQDESMTEKEILTALKGIFIAQRKALDSHRSNGEEANRLLRLTLLRKSRRTGPRPRGPRRRLLRSPGVV